MYPLRGFQRGMAERIGSSSIGGSSAPSSSRLARFSCSSSCASTAFISSSDRTTSKEPIERERLVELIPMPGTLPLPRRPPPPASSLACFSICACLRARRVSRSRSRRASEPSHALCMLSYVWRSCAVSVCTCRQRLPTSGSSAACVAARRSRLRLYTARSEAAVPCVSSCTSAGGSPLTLRMALCACSAFLALSA